MTRSLEFATLLFTVTGVVLVAVWLLQLWFIAELRRAERRVWRLVASSWWGSAFSWPSLAFIQSRRYRYLRSARLRRMGCALQALQVVAGLLFVGWVFFAAVP